ncbi:MAG: DUF433 domain-containing protein [Thermodesulfobacteriota bacterium]|nr:DUF433 domain-containing protein [Thermodesulfobacteriota bacterium]
MIENILGILAAGDSSETILERYPWLEPEDAGDDEVLPCAYGGPSILLSLDKDIGEMAVVH